MAEDTVGEGLVPSSPDASDTTPRADTGPAEDTGSSATGAPATEAQPEEPPFELSEEARTPARRVRDILQDWSTRIAATGGAGRGATITARMASARALAELRRVQIPELPDIAPVRDYLGRAISAVTQAAHDIERNRYSLHEMHHQLERLTGLEKRILPAEQTEDAEPGAEAAAESEQAPET
jgi:hypothetical protein